MKEERILAIDPSYKGSTYILTEGIKPVEFEIVADNNHLLAYLDENQTRFDKVLIESMSSYGQIVGRDVFDTLVWIGRIQQKAIDLRYDTIIYYRKAIVTWHCGIARGGDTGVRKSLIGKYATHDFKSGKGTKNNRDFFYGFHADIWQAFAITAYYYEMSQIIERQKARSK